MDHNIQSHNHPLGNVSLQKLLFTHKPLDTSDKGVQVQSYQNLINEGFEILQTRIIKGH